MGFKEVKAQVIECLHSGKVRHEQRGSIDVKNLLATGVVSPEQGVVTTTVAHITLIVK